MATKADIVYFKCFQDGTLFVLRYHKTKKHSTVDNSIRSLEATLRTMNSAAPFVSVGDLYSGKLRSFGGNDRLDDPLFREIFAPASDRRVEGELALCRDVAMWRASPSQNVESSIMDGDEDGNRRQESQQQLDSPNVRVAKKCRKGEDEEAGLFSEFGKMFNSGLKSQNEGYQTLREVHQEEMKVHKQEMQTLVEENKELYRKNVELGMEVSRLRQKLDKAKAALRVALEKRGGEQGAESSLREKIRLVRLGLARAEGVAAFYIFPNKVLDAIVRALPGTMEELMAIHGIGPKKAGVYGEQILQVINTHLASKKASGESTELTSTDFRPPLEST